jgi:hypothetical protein
VPSRIASFKKFNYLLRPAKQVERKLLMEAFHRLALAGFDFREYTYVGLGSVYYADFILFHKYLYLDKMICVEKSDIPRRMEFNKPFPWIKLRMKAVSEVIPTLKRRQPHLVWLDYDCGLDDEIIRDISGMLRVLADGSVLIITVEAEPRLEAELREGDLTPSQEEDRRYQEAVRVFGRFLKSGLRRRDISRRALPGTLARALRNHIFSEVSERTPQGRFVQLFNFCYSDNAQMLTIGGVVGARDIKGRVNASGISLLPFIRRTEKPYRIVVPPLTVRERQWLEQKLRVSTRSSEVAFELDREPLEHFRLFGRHYPQYFESLG